MEDHHWAGRAAGHLLHPGGMLWWLDPLQLFQIIIFTMEKRLSLSKEVEVLDIERALTESIAENEQVDHRR